MLHAPHKSNRLLSLCALALLSTLLTAAHAGDYVLEINGQKTEIDLDKPVSLTINDGKLVTLALHQKSEQIWRNDGLSFAYPTALKPVRKDIDKDISQTLIATPSGSLVLVQRYTGLNPTHMIDMMISKLTDEEVAAGYKRTIQPAARKLADGANFTGKTAHTESSSESWDREVVAIGDGRQGGYLIVSATHDTSPPTDHEMIKNFWRSLQLRAAPARQ